MVENIWNHLTSLVIGIKYQPNFGFSEKIGDLFDELLYEKKSFFDKDFFKKIESSAEWKKLYNEDNGNHLKVNHTDTILNFETTDFEKAKEVTDNFKSQLLEKLLYKHKITRIQRIGFIYRFEFEDEDLVNGLVAKCSSFKTSDVRDLQLRFSKKIATTSLPKRDINDYDNVIYSIIKDSNSDRILLMVDYQHYYIPLISDTKMIDFDKFIKRVNKYNKKDVSNWLNENYN